MARNSTGNEQEVRMQVYESYKETFASAPIRLMSRTASRMQALGYADMASAIGDVDWRTVPPDLPEDPTLRQDWGELLTDAFQSIPAWLPQLAAHPMGYNLDSVGYPAVTRAWSAMWERQTGIAFSNDGLPPQTYIFHGGNQAVSVAFTSVAEARRERMLDGKPPTILVPIPTFTCPMDQLALAGMRAYLLSPKSTDLDPSPEAIAEIPDNTEIDGIYLMPINNPTGRTTSPQQLAATLHAVLDRWPEAGIILDAVYVRLHPDQKDMLSWYNEDPRFAESVIIVDSLSKSHGVTGLRAGALMTRSERFAAGINRYSQNVLAGPSNAVQAVIMSMLAPFLTGDEDLIDTRVRLQHRIGAHLQRRRQLLLRQIFDRHGELLDDHQPVLPDAESFDWDGSMYGIVRLSDKCVEFAEQQGVPPTVGFYLATGVAGVPLSGFCQNPNLIRHGLLVNQDDEELADFQRRTERYVRLSFGMTPPPRG
ncbi:MAG: pyridoxal phosphate-dependent aminotransferase [bacterium]|nr:pyridoxal phosphate-dependent aminotransferase [bacterium]